MFEREPKNEVESMRFRIDEIKLLNKIPKSEFPPMEDYDEYQKTNNELIEKYENMIKECEEKV